MIDDDTNCLHPRTGTEISWWLMTLIEDQDQLLPASSEWSQRTRSRTQDQFHQGDLRISESRTRINVWQIALKKITRVCVIFVCSYKVLCTIFAKYVELKHTHKEKVFHGKSLLLCLMIRDWDQRTSWFLHMKYENPLALNTSKDL